MGAPEIELHRTLRAFTRRIEEVLKGEEDWRARGLSITEAFHRINGKHEALTNRILRIHRPPDARTKLDLTRLVLDVIASAFILADIAQRWPLCCDCGKAPRRALIRSIKETGQCERCYKRDWYRQTARTKAIIRL